jgi:hypothetical protein
MSRSRLRTIVWCMLNQLHTIADFAADHRRTLQEDADAYRLARTARRAGSAAATGQARRRGWAHLLRVRPGSAPA